MAEGWTRAETRRRHRWCEGKGYSNGAPVCGGKAVVLSDTAGEQRCQLCAASRDPLWCWMLAHNLHVAAAVARAYREGYAAGETEQRLRSAGVHPVTIEGWNAGQEPR